MKILSLFLLLLLITAGCSKPHLLEEEKFIEVYTELIIAQDTSVVPDNDWNVVKEKVFSKTGVTENEYNETLKYYNEDPQRWDQFFNKAIKRLERLKKTHQQIKEAEEKKP